MHLHKKDTELRKLLVQTEVNNIIDVLASDLGVNIEIQGITITPIDMSSHMEYGVNISLTINDKGPYSIGVQEYSTSAY